MLMEFSKDGKVKLSCDGEKSIEAPKSDFLAACERLAAHEVERQYDALTASQFMEWFKSEFTDAAFICAVLAQVKPEVRMLVEAIIIRAADAEDIDGRTLDELVDEVVADE